MKWYRILFFPFFIVACLKVLDSLRGWESSPINKGDEEQIYVISHGWHTGIIISGSNLSPSLSFLKDHFADSLYYEFGWGDKGFYEAETVTTSLAVKAFILPTESVMHVVSLQQPPFDYFSESEIVPIKISKASFQDLQTSIARSFEKEAGVPVKTKKGIYGNSFFFKGKGKYYMTNTCNTWTARTLKSIGAPFGSFLTLSSGDVIRQSKRATEIYNCCEKVGLGQ